MPDIISINNRLKSIVGSAARKTKFVHLFTENSRAIAALAEVDNCKEETKESSWNSYCSRIFYG